MSSCLEDGYSTCRCDSKRSSMYFPAEKERRLAGFQVGKKQASIFLELELTIDMGLSTVQINDLLFRLPGLLDYACPQCKRDQVPRHLSPCVSRWESKGTVE